MSTYISLLRGINVSGHNMIKMPALKDLYEQIGFSNIKTYLQSGNVIFNAKSSEKKQLEQQISLAIKTSLELNISVIVLTAEELQKIIEKNPFPKDTANLYLTYLATPPATFDELIITDKALPGERVVFTPKVIYTYCAQGYGKTRIHTNFLESKLKVVATTRNWKTTNELLKLALS
jgi:uncharacterized protein (DUF1697 family)